jgi:uncharacterized protein
VNVSGERTFDAPLQTVWTVLNDPARLAKTMPGVEGFEVQDERHWTANVKVPLGLGSLRMTIAMEKVEEREPEYAKLNAKGQGVGAMMNMVTQFHLSEQGSGTQMHWEADVSIAGPVGSMGQRVLQPIVNQQVGNVLTALEKQVEEARAEGVGGEVRIGSQPGGGDPLAEGTAHAGTGGSSEAAGTAGASPPGTDAAPKTDPQVKDAGLPAEGVADPEGSSGAEEGLNPWAPESYSSDPDGPTTSTEDS